MSSTFFSDRDLGTMFPAIFREAGVLVERHADHFAPDEHDEIWLTDVAARRWVALTHDRRIRYEPNKLAAVRRARARLLIVRHEGREAGWFADRAQARGHAAGVDALAERLERFRAA